MTLQENSSRRYQLSRLFDDDKIWNELSQNIFISESHEKYLIKKDSSTIHDATIVISLNCSFCADVIRSMKEHSYLEHNFRIILDNIADKFRSNDSLAVDLIKICLAKGFDYFMLF